MIWWSRGLTASGLTDFKAYRLIAFLIFFCPKYLGRNHWALTLFHSASICVAFISRISLVNPVSTVAFISSRFLPRADTSRYSSRVSLNEDAVSNPGVSSGMSSTFGGFGKSEDWSTIEQIINDMGVLHSLLLNYSKNIAKATQIKQNLSVQLTEGLRSFRDMHAHSLNELYQLAERLVNIENRLSSTLGISAETLYMNSADWINIRDSRVGIWSNNLRIDMPRALLRIFFWSMPTSELWIAAWVKDGMFEANLANNSLWVIVSKFVDICLYFAMIW